MGDLIRMIGVLAALAFVAAAAPVFIYVIATGTFPWS